MVYRYTGHCMRVLGLPIVLMMLTSCVTASDSVDVSTRDTITAVGVQMGVSKQKALSIQQAKIGTTAPSHLRQPHIQGHGMRPEASGRANTVPMIGPQSLPTPEPAESDTFVPPLLGSEKVIISPGTRQQVEIDGELQMDDAP